MNGNLSSTEEKPQTKKESLYNLNSIPFMIFAKDSTVIRRNSCTILLVPKKNHVFFPRSLDATREVIILYYWYNNTILLVSFAS